MTTLDLKRCNGCQIGKPFNAFYPRSNRDGVQSRCIACQLAANRARYAKVGRKQSLESRRKFTLKQYGLTIEDYERMLAEQGDVCAICANPEQISGINFLAVDHDEVTGKVRGLLCGNCNRAIGLLKHDPARIMGALAYLRKNQ